MKKLLKIIFVLFVLFLVAVSVFLFTFDANKYKHEISEIVQSYSGRPITLGGDVKLSLYPWIGVQLQNVTIGNNADASSEGFGKNEFARIERFGVNIKILPLFRRHLEIDKLIIHRLAVDFEVNKAGENNWSDLIGDSENSEKEAGLNGLVVGGVEITESRLSWLDASTGKYFKLTSMNVTTEAFVEGRPLPMVFSADIESSQPQWQASSSFKTELVFDTGSPVFDAKNLRLVIKAKSPIKDMAPVTYSLVADGRVNINEKNARLDNANINILNLDINGSFDIEDIFSVPTIQGPIAVSKFEASVLAKHFNVDLPELAVDSSLKDVSLTANFKTDFNALNFEKLSARVDNSRIKGFVKIMQLAEDRPVVRYDLDIDKIISDDYRLANEEDHSNGYMLPLDFIRSVDFKGVIDVATLMLGDLSVSSLHLPVVINHSVVTLNPISMIINKASIRAAMELNAMAMPVARMAIKINNLNAMDSTKSVFKNILGEKQLLIDGVVSATADFKSTGNSITDHRSSLTGEFKVNMEDLVIQGVDLNHVSKKVVAEYANRNDFHTRKSYVPDYDPNLKDSFRRLRATFNVAGNKITTKDILLVSDSADITGAGTLDFQNKTLSYRSVVDMHVNNRIDIRDKLLDHPMEYDVMGTFGNLMTNFDVDRYDLRVGRLLMIEAKARKIRAIKNKDKNTW